MSDKVIHAMLDADFTPIHVEKFENIYEWADNFESYAHTILEDTTPLTLSELSYIKGWGSKVDYFFTDSNFVPESSAKSHVITDIFNYDDEVLHEAVGRLNPVIIFFEHPGEDTLLAGIGYTMSYYEFLEPEHIRLDDADWKDILGTSNPQRPPWTSGFLEN